MASTTASSSGGSGESNSTRRPSPGCVKASRARVQEGTFEPHYRAQVLPDAAVHAAVGLVADDRVADGAQMHADLMSTAGGDCDPDERHSLEVPREGHACHRAARPARAGRHLLPVLRIAPDRLVDAPPGVHDTPDERDVFLLDFAVLKLPRQLLVGLVVLGDDHQSRGAAIETVHDSRARLAAHSAQVLDVVQQGVHERAARMPGPGMDDHPRRLVEDNDIRVFEDDAQRQCLRLRRRRTQLRDVDDEALAGADGGAGTHRAARRGGDVAFLDEPLDLRPRLAGQNRGQELVQPEAVVIVLDDERVRGGSRIAHRRITRRDGPSPPSGRAPRAGPGSRA